MWAKYIRTSKVRGAIADQEYCVDRFRTLRRRNISHRELELRTRSLAWTIRSIIEPSPGVNHLSRSIQHDIQEYMKIDTGDIRPLLYSHF